MKISEAGIRQIANDEGLMLIAYDDATGKPPKLDQRGKPTVKGTLTIGYGHTKGVYVGQTCTKPEAVAWLHEDISDAEAIVVRARVSCRLEPEELRQHEHDALGSLAFNMGSRPFLKRANVWARLYSKQFNLVPSEILQWRVFKGKVNAGLVKRRDHEAVLWSDGAYQEDMARPSLRTLKRMMWGHDVSELQRRLSIAFPVNPRIVVDGSFGKITESRLMDFQHSLGFAGMWPPGICNAATWEALRRCVQARGEGNNVYAVAAGMLADSFKRDAIGENS